VGKHWLYAAYSVYNKVVLVMSVVISVRPST